MVSFSESTKFKFSSECFLVIAQVYLWNDRITSFGQTVTRFGFLRVYAQQWDCWVIWWFYSQFVVVFFFKESPYHLPKWLYKFTSHQTLQESSLFSTPCPAFTVCRMFDDGHSDCCDCHKFHLRILMNMGPRASISLRYQNGKDRRLD